MLEHRQATDGRNPFCVRHSRSQLSGYAVLHFTYLRAPVVKVPRLVAPTGESKLSSTSHGHKGLWDALWRVGRKAMAQVCTTSVQLKMSSPPAGVKSITKTAN